MNIFSNMINYSIIIPHYNIPDLLARCLRSIPERDDVQVIVVDDNSPGHENYLGSIPELSRKNVEFYATTDGLGAGHARNIGLNHAVGKWLVFADSDDFFVENFSDILDEYVNSPSDIIYFNTMVCDCYDTSKVFSTKGKEYILQKYHDTSNDIYLRICYTEPWGKLMKNSLVANNDIKFQETKAHNDLLFAVKAGLAAESVQAVDCPLYWYVIREGLLRHQKGPEPLAKVCDRLKAWHETQLLLESKGIRTNINLPVHTYLAASKRDFNMFFKLLLFMKNNGMSVGRTLWGAFKYLLLRVINKESLSFDNLLSSDSVALYTQKQGRSAAITQLGGVKNSNNAATCGALHVEFKLAA